MEAWEKATEAERQALDLWVVYRVRFGDILYHDGHEKPVYAGWLEPIAIREKTTRRDLALLHKPWEIGGPVVRLRYGVEVTIQDLDRLEQVAQALAEAESIRRQGLEVEPTQFDFSESGDA